MYEIAVPFLTIVSIVASMLTACTVTIRSRSSWDCRQRVVDPKKRRRRKNMLYVKNRLRSILLAMLSLLGVQWKRDPSSFEEGSFCVTSTFRTVRAIYSLFSSLQLSCRPLYYTPLRSPCAVEGLLVLYPKPAKLAIFSHCTNQSPQQMGAICSLILSSTSSNPIASIMSSDPM